MDSLDLVFIAGYIVGLILALLIQYLVIKYAVYAGIKHYQDNKPGERDYETIRDAVEAGLRSFEEFKNEDKKG